MSRLMSSCESCRPAGRPSTMQVRPGPCDSPAVMRRSATAPSLFARRSALVARAGGGVCSSRECWVTGELEDARLGRVAHVGKLREPLAAEQFASRLGLAAQDAPQRRARCRHGGDAHEPQFRDDRFAAGREVFQLLGLAGLKLYRLAL